MSRRRRRVKIKSSSRLFAFILSFNLLLLASCVTAHYQQRPELDELEVHTMSPLQQTQQQHQQALMLDSSLTNSQITQRNHFHQNQKQAPSSIAQLQSSQQQQQLSLLSDDNLGAAERHSNNNNHNNRNLNRDNADPTTTAAATTSSVAPTAAIPSISGLCSTLPPVTARQLRLCRFVSRSPNADEAVAVGAARGLAECRQQFRSERWNCTHAGGDHHLLTSKLAQSVGNREGGFVQAIVAAGIVHSIATACSIGSLNDCACDKSRVGPIRQRDQNWKWGGCSNNIRHGMVYARHLVELLDAVHEHHHHQMQRSLGLGERLHSDHHHRPTRGHHHQQQQQQNYHHHHQLKKRSLVAMTPNPRTALQQQDQPAANICQKNQNISQTIHIQLIKSLLAKNSLERHQDFRLAMNAHNNKIGRMAVAKNMEIKCRCHGLSGSCSLKTCWLRLPDFQQIGAHLKRKYESSIHLPTAINVNKLIPMMDRDEISAILLQQQPVAAAMPPQQQASGDQAATLTESSNSLRAAVLSGQPTSGQLVPGPEFAAWSSEAPTPAVTPPARLNYYERHKQLEQQRFATPTGSTTTNTRLASLSQLNLTNGSKLNTTSLYLHGDEVPVQIAPMSQQQYQTLLRDMKLCNSSHVQAGAISTRSHLITRDLHNQQFDQHHQAGQRHSKQQTIGRKSQAAMGANSLAPNNDIGASRLLAASMQSHRLPQTITDASQQQHQHNQQQLSHLLQWNSRDELVHLHKSPDYCEPDLRHGFAGVQARLCSNDPQAPDSCDRLCCGRGFERREIELRYNCDCKFQYCCKIHCNVCQKTLVEFVCK